MPVPPQSSHTVSLHRNMAWQHYRETTRTHKHTVPPQWRDIIQHKGSLTTTTRPSLICPLLFLTNEWRLSSPWLPFFYYLLVRSLLFSKEYNYYHRWKYIALENSSVYEKIFVYWNKYQIQHKPNFIIYADMPFKSVNCRGLPWFRVFLALLGLL